MVIASSRIAPNNKECNKAETLVPEATNKNVKIVPLANNNKRVEHQDKNHATCNNANNAPNSNNNAKVWPPAKVV